MKINIKGLSPIQQATIVKAMYDVAMQLSGSAYARMAASLTEMATQDTSGILARLTHGALSLNNKARSAEHSIEEFQALLTFPINRCQKEIFFGLRMKLANGGEHLLDLRLYERDFPANMDTLKGVLNRLSGLPGLGYDNILVMPQDVEVPAQQSIMMHTIEAAAAAASAAADDAAGTDASGFDGDVKHYDFAELA